ncbi:hypothetical protein E8E11_005762 [Didymella keratinophila]|nr:hypothetical protein E8E11_005762 [Didymella keratinophila]
MPPKKEAAAPNTTIEGYDVKETRILAAAFVSSLGAGKYDWPLFAKLTGFTEGSLKKFWPPVKNKAIEQTESFGAFLNGTGAVAAAPKAAAAAGGKKRKAADADADTDLDPKTSSADTTDGKAAGGKTKEAPAKKRGKKVKAEEAEDEKVKDEENSADGGDGLGEFVYSKNVVDWLDSTDGTADEA